MRGIGAGARGITRGGQAFSGFTETVGASFLGNARRAQDVIMQRHPGVFVIELVTGHAEPELSTIIMSIPKTPHANYGDSLLNALNSPP